MVLGPSDEPCPHSVREDGQEPRNRNKEDKFSHSACSEGLGTGAMEGTSHMGRSGKPFLSWWYLSLILWESRSQLWEGASYRRSWE